MEQVVVQAPVVEIVVGCRGRDRRSGLGMSQAATGVEIAWPDKPVHKTDPIACGACGLHVYVFKFTFSPCDVA